jgi:hypothetical protein
LCEPSRDEDIWYGLEAWKLRVSHVMLCSLGWGERKTASVFKS